jgi:RHS repeat-associated protein
LSDFHYDGLGRLTGEDYSPCLASQPAYTSPNLATGEGLEAFYRYDAYEAEQVSPEPGSPDDPKFALGNLVAVHDRGSHTRFNYDARDRVRRISRQVAKPEGLVMGSPYAPHWFSTRLDYDLGSRLTRQTTGVDVAELLMNGTSEARYGYSARGLPFSIDSSYGHLIENVLYDPDGAPHIISYGDRSGTRATFEYDGRRRLTRYNLRTFRPNIVPFEFPRTYFDYRFSSYDLVGNPLVIEDTSKGETGNPLNPGHPLPGGELPPVLPPDDPAPVQTRKMDYDDLYRLTRIDYTYLRRPGLLKGVAPWRSPFEAEISAGDRHPVPLRALPTRVTQQTFNYDGLGNLTASSDDLSARYDRSLGPHLAYGTPQNGPNQLRSGEGLQIRYDPAGNLAEIKIERPGNCPTGAASQCAQWLVYDWDEVGQLARARRWDFDGNALPPQASPDVLPAEQPSWDVTYAYSQGARVRKSVANAAGVARHTLEVFDTLRVEQTPFDPTEGNYQVSRDTVHAYPGGMAHVFWDSDGQLPHQAPGSAVTMQLIVGDHLGSSSAVINHATSELVERTTYQPYGAVESDYRPSKWKAFREPTKFTGKEEDIEVGATYFGARYYHAQLGRWMSADPLSVQALGSDLNPYAYVAGRVMTHVDPLGLDGTDVTRTDWCAPGYCNGELPNDHAMNASRAEAMADQASTHRLESLNRGGISNPLASTGSDKQFLGLPPEGRSTDRMLEAQMKCKDDPACNTFWLAIGAGAAAPFLLEAAPVSGGLLYARGGLSGLALIAYLRAAYVNTGLFISAATGAGGVSVVASSGRLGNYGVRIAPIYERVYNVLRGNLRLVYKAPGINRNFVNAAWRYPRLAPAVFGKAFELRSVAVTPNLVDKLGGAYEADATIRYGNQLVSVDWTTWGQVEQHLERSYYELEPFIFYIHEGLR